MKKAALIISLLILLLLVLGLQARNRYQDFLNTPLDIPVDGTVFIIDPGLTGRAAARQLQIQGLSHHDWQWRVLMRLEPPVLKVGEYLLQSGLTPKLLLEVLQGGDVIRYRFTIVEGWTAKQLITALKADAALGTVLAARSADEILQEVLPDIDHPEGQFLPETYVYTRGDTAVDILLRAHQALENELAQAWNNRVDDHPLENPYELLTLASIIEKETARDDERAQVSGVFVRRLKTGMRLQTDPTVIYGMGESFDGDIRRRDLQTDTPYNTYTRHGLPPTPIALAGPASLIAAARPEEGDALFFVADGKGGHTFSATLKEHQRAVNKLLGRN
jgi:UPF0755 protein